MTHKILFLFSCAAFIVSCKKQQPESTMNTTKPTGAAMHCYRSISNKDTFTLNTTTKNDIVTGRLEYLFHEKDRSKGTIQGQMVGDLLLADYTFNAEGMQSIRQVAFKKNGNTLVEGYGDVEEINGKVVFKNIDSLRFGQSLVLSEIECTD